MPVFDFWRAMQRPGFGKHVFAEIKSEHKASPMIDKITGMPPHPVAQIKNPLIGYVGKQRLQLLPLARVFESLAALHVCVIRKECILIVNSSHVFLLWFVYEKNITISLKHLFLYNEIIVKRSAE